MFLEITRLFGGFFLAPALQQPWTLVLDYIRWEGGEAGRRRARSGTPSIRRCRRLLPTLSGCTACTAWFQVGPALAMNAVEALLFCAACWSTRSPYPLRVPPTFPCPQLCAVQLHGGGPERARRPHPDVHARPAGVSASAGCTGGRGHPLRTPLRAVSAGLSPRSWLPRPAAAPRPRCAHSGRLPAWFTPHAPLHRPRPPVRAARPRTACAPSPRASRRWTRWAWAS